MCICGEKYMSIQIGFVINPIAGMGGRVGLKGTDNVYDKAVSLGAKPVAIKRSVQCLQELKKICETLDPIQWITCSKDMGEYALEKVHINNYKIVYSSEKQSTLAYDTKSACEIFLENNVDLIVFCGGDGTARDIVNVIDKKIPLLGIPSGVKMHSGIFGVTPEATAKILQEFISGTLRTGDVEILDLDEDLYRRGEWKVRLYANAKGLVEPTYIQVGKQVFSEMDEQSIKDELAEHILDEMNANKDTLFLFGSGGTIDYIAEKLHLENSLLGIDAVFNKKTIAKDLNEKQIIQLINKHKSIKLIISPIGAQGFIIGRGNLQLSPLVIRKIGIDNIIVVSTPSKILVTPYLRVDSGDIDLDKQFQDLEMIMVVIGYRLKRVVKIQKTN
jgi:predicted polyphosphate/ATP-dependent NAD kinase